MQQDLAVLAEDTHVHAASMQINAAIRFVLFGVKSPEILCRGTRRTRAAGVQLLQTSTTQLAEPRQKESNDGYTSGDLQGSGNYTSADPVFGL
jgi:hypothetical protein